MPDDLAKKVSKTLNKKRNTPEDELANALDEMARVPAPCSPDARPMVLRDPDGE